VRPRETLGERLVERREEVAVPVKRHGDRAVAELLLDGERVFSLSDQERS